MALELCSGDLFSLIKRRRASAAPFAALRT